MSARILYIEDDPQQVDLITFFLKDYHVTGVCDGAEGLELALTSKPDLILLDVNLPDMNASEFITRLKRQPALQHIPVVALTADSRFDGKGCNACLFKPYRFFELAQVVSNFIS